MTRIGWRGSGWGGEGHGEVKRFRECYRGPWCMEKPGRIKEDQGVVERVRVGGEGQGRVMKAVEGWGGRWKGW